MLRPVSRSALRWLPSATRASVRAWTASTPPARDGQIVCPRPFWTARGTNQSDAALSYGHGSPIDARPAVTVDVQPALRDDPAELGAHARWNGAVGEAT